LSCIYDVGIFVLKALLGLSRSETVRQIISKLPLFTNGQLQCKLLCFNVRTKQQNKMKLPFSFHSRYISRHFVIDVIWRLPVWNGKFRRYLASRTLQFGSNLFFLNLISNFKYKTWGSQIYQMPVYLSAYSCIQWLA
jgi:hypothetical protein